MVAVALSIPDDGKNKIKEVFGELKLDDLNSENEISIPF